MIYCQTCGKSLHETARFCPHCGRQFSEEISTSVPASLWMAITALTLGIFTLILLLSAASDMETLSALGVRTRVIIYRFYKQIGFIFLPDFHGFGGGFVVQCALWDVVIVDGHIV